MRLEFDLNVGALYIRLSNGEIARTHPAGDNAVVDLNAAGEVVGIEVISAAHPWPLADILGSYVISAGEALQLRSYFLVPGRPAAGQESPKISIASPPPTQPLAAA
jgi:uncharacterized protein YuzE